MQKSDLVFLFDYNAWANARVLAAVRQLPPEQLTAPTPVSFGNLMGTLAHILSAEMSWRLRMQEGISPTFLLTAEQFPTLEALEMLWQEEMTKMKEFVDSLTDEDLNRWVDYSTTSGKPQGSTLWRALAHVVNHGTQFRAEAGVILSSYGRSPGDMDLILYERETDQR